MSTQGRICSRLLPAACAVAALAAWAADAAADKGEIKSLGFDFFFNPNPGESPEVVDVYEGEYLKFVLHQHDIYGVHGLAVPEKNKVEDGSSYFLYPGNYCAQSCSDAEQLARPGEVYPFSQTYYVLAQPQQGSGLKVVLLPTAVVAGEDVLSRAKKPKGVKGPSAALGPDASDAAHPEVEAIPLDEGPSAGPQGFGGLASNEIPSLLEKYFFKPVDGATCGQLYWELRYEYEYVGDDQKVHTFENAVQIGTYEEGDAPVDMQKARAWLDAQLKKHQDDRVTVSLSDSGSVVLAAKVPAAQQDVYSQEDPTRIELPQDAVLGLRVVESGKCGRYLGFTGKASKYSFPFPEEMPGNVYERAPFVSEICSVDEALGAELRPKLKDEKKKVFRCTFQQAPSFKGPFWAYLTSVSGKGKVRVMNYPVVALSNGLAISNVEARVSYEGSPESAESFHNPSMDMPIYYYDVPKAKPGVYAVTPVITYEDPSGGSAKVKAGHVIYIKVRPREDLSMIRLQMGIIAYSELRAMAFTVMITPVLNKSFFKRKFFPAPYPMPHIGIRLGSQDDGGILGLQVGFGIALLKEFIIVGGLQFGTADLTTPWDARKAWYIGVALDPWLLQRSLSGKSEED